MPRTRTENPADEPSSTKSGRSSRPTRGETELLSLLWEHGDLTLSEVHTLLERSVGYTTVQTRLNRLVEKGLAEREKVGRKPMVYRAAIRPDQVGAGMLDSLVSEVTRGRVVPLVAHLVQSTDLSVDEIAQLRQLIEQAEQRNADGPAGSDGSASEPESKRGARR